MSIVTVAAVVATAFNLACSGTTTESSGPDKSQKAMPFHHIYRVDLDSLRWCVDACPLTYPIVGVTQQEIKLLEGTDDETVINRGSGRMVRTLGGPGDAVIDFGECEKVPFTQFPKSKF